MLLAARLLRRVSVNLGFVPVIACWPRGPPAPSSGRGGRRSRRRSPEGRVVHRQSPGCPLRRDLPPTSHPELPPLYPACQKLGVPPQRVPLRPLSVRSILP